MFLRAVCVNPNNHSEDQVSKNKPEQASGILYIVATPIGNLADITSRAIEVLGAADVIAAEDTRHSQRLLSAYSIETRLVAYHEHNEVNMTARLLGMLHDGQSIALVSDAGTPLISDPGYRLVSEARDNGVRVVPVPGASAALAALSVSGLATDRFLFDGFMPAKQVARRQYLEAIKHQRATIVVYESCHRIEAALSDMMHILGNERRICFAREMTKTFETIRRDTLANIHHWVSSDDNQHKGEIVIVIEGDQKSEADNVELDEVLKILLAELPVKQAVSLAVKLTGGHKNTIYKRAIEIKDDQ
jgi:16S rRNA (cytidine1402-2'-O)-methyltransferase